MVKISVFILLISLVSGEWFNRSLRFPPDLSVENYVITSPDMADFQTGFTICAWVKPWHSGNRYGVWFSYEISRSDNEISI